MGRYRLVRLLIVLLADVVLLSALAGCAETSVKATTTPTPAATATLTPTPMPPPTGNLAKVQIGLVPFATGLVRPDYLTYANDGSGRVYILEQAGRIRVANAQGQLYPQPFLDVQTQWFAELGLMGMALHPRFKTNGLFFISYSDVTTGDTLIARYETDDGNPLRADPDSAQVILHIKEPKTQEHRSGMLTFGPDGYLYIGVGDGGRGGAQRKWSAHRHDPR